MFDMRAPWSHGGRRHASATPRHGITESRSSAYPRGARNARLVWNPDSGGRMFSQPPRPLSLVAGVIVALLVGVTSAAAQTSTLSSGIEGRVTDESGAAMPGVSVTIKSPALQTPELETVSDELG